jgi:hypothetical protein
MVVDACGTPSLLEQDAANDDGLRMKMTVFALLLAGCASVAPVASSTGAAPIAPASREYGATVAKSVGAYLRTFKLDEKTIAAGLAIPWAGVDPKRDYINGSGMAVATGRLGPQGHQVTTRLPPSRVVLDEAHLVRVDPTTGNALQTASSPSRMSGSSV